MFFTFIAINVFILEGFTQQNKNLSNPDTSSLVLIAEKGLSFFKSGNLDSSAYWYNAGYQKAREINHKRYKTHFLFNMGLIEREKGIVNKSFEYFYKALELAEKDNLPQYISKCYNGIATLNTTLKQFDSALVYFQKSMTINQKNNNKKGLSSDYNNLGLVYLDQGNNSVALKHFLKAYELNKEEKYTWGIAANSENIGIVYTELKNYPLAMLYYQKALQTWYQNQDWNSVSINLGYIGHSLIKQGRFEEAIDTLTKANILAEKANALGAKKDICMYLSEAHTKVNDFEKAFYFYRVGKSLHDSLLNNENTRQVTEIQLNYAFNKIKTQDSIRHRMEVQVKEVQLKSEKNFKYIISIILAFLFILLLFIFRGYQQKKKTNKIITEQKNLVEQKQKEIVDSINYAQRIQSALLKHDDLINSEIKEHFIYFKPKDIVSGDFYWASKNNNKLYLAVCDCTGHGVPGAFMSLLNISYLNEAIKEQKISAPNKIFDYVRLKLIESMQGRYDGMDAILFCIDLNNSSNEIEISYAAANNAPVLVRNNIIELLAKDRMPVGNSINNLPFNEFKLKINPGDCVYLYTDGYGDQFGGPKGKKFKHKKLNQLLLDIHPAPTSVQHQKIDDTFKHWIGDLEQVDDICILGLKF